MYNSVRRELKRGTKFIFFLDESKRYVLCEMMRYQLTRFLSLGKKISSLEEALNEVEQALIDSSFQEYNKVDDVEWHATCTLKRDGICSYSCLYESKQPTLEWKAASDMTLESVVSIVKYRF